MKKGMCAIWGTLATITQTDHGDGYVSERAGGQYRIEKISWVKTDQKRFDDAARARLTTWILDQNRLGVFYPLITEAILDDVMKSKPIKMSKKIERFFLFLDKINVQMCTEISTTYLGAGAFVGDLNDKIKVYTELMNDNECHDFKNILIEMKCFNELGQLSRTGFEFLEKYTTENINSNQVFVAMWFDETMNEIYDQGFEPGIQKDTGLTAHRIDKGHFTGKIDDEIIAEIRRSKFVVADFTCGETVRGGVYYEAGFAQGLGKQVIFTCHADQIQQVHFDTRQFNHILWQTPADLQKQLNDRIKALGLAIA